jgi:hypothetical protein
MTSLRVRPEWQQQAAQTGMQLLTPPASKLSKALAGQLLYELQQQQQMVCS